MSEVKFFSAASNVIEPPSLWAGGLPGSVSHQISMIESDGGLVWRVGDDVSAPLLFPREVAKATGSDCNLDLANWLSSVDGRRWLQDRDGVGGEVLYARGGVWDLIEKSGDRDLIVACCRAYNYWLAQFCNSDPKRFVGIAKIPNTGLDDAVTELNRACGELGLKGALLDGWPVGPEPEGPPALLSTEFWAAAQDLGVPISLHRGLSDSSEPDTGVVGGYAPDISPDISAIVFAGVCDNFPKLRFVLVDSDPGWVPGVLEISNEVYMRSAHTRQFSLKNEDAMPADYVREFFWFTVQEDRFSVLNRNYFGKAHLMWSSFCGAAESVWPNNPQTFELTTSGLAEEDKASLASNVVSRLYRLEGASDFTTEEIKDFDSYALL